MLGKTIVCLPITMICLGCFSIMCLCFDSSSDMVRRLLLFWVIGIRSVLCIVFLSQLTKKSVLAPLGSIMLLLVFGQSDLYEVAHSPLALLCCGQCVSLGTEITNAFITKVIVSAVVSCVIYYLIGYLTLKKKIALELHQLTSLLRDFIDHYGWLLFSEDRKNRFTKNADVLNISVLSGNFVINIPLYMIETINRLA